MHFQYSSWTKFCLEEKKDIFLVLYVICKMSETDFAHYADDHTAYVLNNGIDRVIKSLQDESLNLFKWFPDHSMETNSKKYHLMTNIQSCMNIKIANANAENGICEDLLLVKVGLSPSTINYFICFC